MERQMEMEHCNADSNPLVTWNWAQLSASLNSTRFTQSMGLFCIWHQIKHFISLWPVRQADERKFLKASVDLCPFPSSLSLSPLCHSFRPVQFFNMPKSCVKISQRDRKQRYKLYELIKQRDPKRGKGQKTEWERGRGGLKIWHMTLIVVPCVRVHAVLCFCPLVPKHFFSFSVIAHIYGTKWGEQRGIEGSPVWGLLGFCWQL